MFICAHSGFDGAPDNSLQSIRAGAECAPFTEVDVRVNAYGEAYLSHDALVSGRPYVPLREALLTVRELGLTVNLDLKQPEAARPCAELCVELGLSSRAFFTGLEPEWAALVAGMNLPVRHMLNVPRQLAADPCAAVAAALSVHACGLNLQFRGVTEELVHAAGLSLLPVWAWTVNLPEDKAYMARLQVFGITTRTR